MTSPWERLAFDLEGFITDDHTGVPEAALLVYNENVANREPSALANHPEYGWFVLCSAGQGPCVDWAPEGFVPPENKYGRMPPGW